MNRAIFLDRDGTITKSTDLITNTKDLEMEDNAAEGIKLFNKLGMKVIVVTNQPQIARGMCTEEDVQKINEKMINDLARLGAKIDRVYYCPHHPEHHADVPEHAKKYRIVCECRKPEAGMIKEAARDFSIDLSRSFAIGDRTVDTLAGKNAGCKTIIVKTGYAGLDKKHDVVADYEAKDLLDAAKQIAMDNVSAIILVGGKGERLGDLTKDVPKPLIPVGGKPVVQHQVELLRRGGIKKIIMCGSYMIDKIKGYFGNGGEFGVSIKYTDEPEAMGTGGAVKLAKDFVGDTFFVLNGDIALKNFDFFEIANFHVEKGALVTMILRDTDHPKDSDVVKIDEDNRVVNFIGKGQEQFTTGNTGIFVASKDLFNFIPEGRSNIERDVLSKIYSDEIISGFKIKEGWIAKDMGTPDRLESVRKMFGD